MIGSLHYVFPGLSVTSQAPRIFSWTTRNGVPLPALLLTSSISALCFGSSYIGSGALWGWLQNLVGVSNQVHIFIISLLSPTMANSITKIAWFSIGLASWRFRRAWVKQGRSLSEMKYRASWTWPWGPYFVVRTFYGYSTYYQLSNFHTPIGYISNSDDSQ